MFRRPVVRSPVLVGRSAELEVAMRLVHAAVGGSGAAVLVAGEAGIGKSRLLQEVAAHAAGAGLVVLSGRAVQGGGTYRAVAEAVIGTLDRPALRELEELRPYRAVLGRLLPGWAGGGPGPPDVDQSVVLGEGLVRLLEAAGGCVLLLEDLHWADEDTLALVEHLAVAVRTAPVLLAVSARDDAPAGVVRRLTAVPGMTTLRLGRLDAADVATLAAACRDGAALPATEAARLLDRSEGVPFLVEELLERPGDGVPPTLAGLVGARLDVLAEGERDVLLAAAVLGSEPDWRLLAPTVGMPEQAVLRALRAAAAAGLLASDGERLCWPHALTREAVLATLLPPERAVLSRRAAQALVTRAGPDDEPLAAELFREAGEPGHAAGLLLELARRAVARGALRAAEQLLERAALTGALVAEVTTERVAVLAGVGRVDEAIGLGSALLDRVSGDAHAELCLRLARASVVGSGWAEAERYVERAGRPQDARALVVLADAAFGAGRVDEADALADAAIAAAERDGAHAALCEALGIRARTMSHSDPAAMAAAFRRGAQVAAEHGLTTSRVEAVTQLSMFEAMVTDGPTVALVRARELALDAGMLAQLVSIDIVSCDHTMTVDGPRAAEPVARRALDVVTTLRLPELSRIVEVAMAGCVGAGGDAAGMNATLDEVRRRAGGNQEVAAHASWARSVVALLDHDLPRASELAGAAVDFLLGHGSAPPLTVFGAWALLRTAVDDGGAEARALIGAHPSQLRTANRGALLYAEAVAAGRAGRADDAAALLADGDVALAGLHWWRRLLRLVALEAAVVDGWGDPVPPLLADLAVHEHAGSADDRLARTCRDLLRRAGQPTRRGRGSGPVPPGLRRIGVTSREVDVLVLVGRGLTNAQVAARLFLSTRTVDSHVASLLGKTGATGRGELRSFVESNGL